MNQKKLIALIATIALIIIVIGIGSQFRVRPVTTSSVPGMGGEFYAESALSSRDMAVSEMIAPSFDPSAGKTAAETDARLIKTGSVTLSVDTIEPTVQDIIRIAEENQGFVQSSNVYEDYEGRRMGWVTVRVPSDVFEPVQSAIKDLAVLVKAESSDVQDVTEQYTDLQARLSNARAEEVAYLELMKRTGSVSEILEVQREISRVRGDIESLEGRIQYLENQTGYSTITVNLEEETTITLASKKFRILPIFKEAIQSVIVVARWVVTAVIWIVILAIGIGLPAWVLFLIGRGLGKRFKR